ncbi:flagellar M-ring protein FliF [Achromobacter sp. GG226]|uniref:flagellar basal-body MS-ring/collar protein FliF n=1 Tax=Verticiella alkaliphila TaxID=2779529 RepID=UPI001C0B5070|nr:flagellar basal-body MS-ring/collar protein FliF [Verticiella sp. GG226]MBU4610484.1 flagellar M-ring protein FliF [Verticiella sp. GG226]
MNTTAALNPFLDRMKSAPRALLLVGAALLVAVIVAFALWSRGPEYRVLFANLAERDGGAIVAALNQMNVPYRFADGSAALMVPAERVHETRLALAAQGLPRGGSVGFELLDNAKFGASQFTEQVNFQRALEGELARSIASVQSVREARVHLALPRQSMFVRDRQPPTASVMLQLYPGRALDEAQVAAIAHLVSASVPELNTANISIVDQFGRLLSLPVGEGRGADPAEFRRLREIERGYAQRIEAILVPLLGPGNAHAQVTADVDFSRREETQEAYRPNQSPDQAAVRSRQSSDSLQSGAPGPQGVPGALTNQPPAATTAPLTDPAAQANAEGAQTAAAVGTGGANAPAIPTTERRDATVNYEVDRTITHLRHATGTVARLSVAVIVNHLPDAEGNLQALPAEQLERLRGLVMQAMGYSEARGDSLELLHSAFVTPVEPEVPMWQDPVIIDLAKTAGGWLLFLVIALWLWFGLARPLLRRQTGTAGAGTAGIAAGGLPGMAGLPPDEEAEEAERTIAAAAKARQQSRYDENLQTARDLAVKDPRAVAAVIRTWMEKDES